MVSISVKTSHLPFLLANINECNYFEKLLKKDAMGAEQEPPRPPAQGDIFFSPLSLVPVWKWPNFCPQIT